MRAEKDILRDVIGTDQPKEESKTRKYIRIIFTFVFLSLFAILVIMAALRKCGA